MHTRHQKKRVIYSESLKICTSSSDERLVENIAGKIKSNESLIRLHIAKLFRG